MPARYYEGPKEIYESGRWPIFQDIEPIPPQIEKMWMLREQIQRYLRKQGKEIPEPIKKWPWTKKYYAKTLRDYKDILRKA